MADSIKWEGREYQPLEEHEAESKWQYCNCLSCQNKRFFLESLPGAQINWDKWRAKDERY